MRKLFLDHTFDKELIQRIYKEFLKLKDKKTFSQTIQLNNMKNTYIFHPRSKMVNELMQTFNIIDHMVNINQKDSLILPHTH